MLPWGKKGKEEKQWYNVGLRYIVKMTGPLLNTQSFLKGPLDFDGSPTPDNLTLMLP